MPFMILTSLLPGTTVPVILSHNQPVADCPQRQFHPTGRIGGESIAPETLVKQKIALAVWVEEADIANGIGSRPGPTFGNHPGRP